MYRNRSTSVYADSREDFLADLKLRRSGTLSHGKHIVDNKTQILESSLDEQSYDDCQLGRAHNFRFEIIRPSIKDQQSEDESKVESMINHIVDSIRAKEYSMDYDLISNSLNRDLVFKCSHQISDCDDDFSKFNSPVDDDSALEYKQVNSLESSQISSDCINGSCLAVDLSNFIQQNLIQPERIFKVLVLGSKSSGKSTFVGKIIGNERNCHPIEPTQSIIINKRHFTFGNTESISRIEMIDTNENIGRSKMLNPYVKLSTSVVIVSSYTIESFEFCLDVINRIKYLDKSKKIIVILNGTLDCCLYQDYKESIPSGASIFHCNFYDDDHIESGNVANILSLIVSGIPGNNDLAFL